MENRYDVVERQRIERERNRMRFFLRLWGGVKKVIFLPWLGIIPVALLTALLCVALNNRALPFDTIVHAKWFQAYDYAKIGGLAVVYIAFLLGLLVWLGTPIRTRSTQNCLMTAFKVQGFFHGKCPILISYGRIKGGVARLEFYTKWLPMEDWKKCQAAIEDALDCHLVEPIQYGGKNGNNRRRVVLTVAPGYKPAERGEVHDDEL